MFLSILLQKPCQTINYLEYQAIMKTTKKTSTVNPTDIQRGDRTHSHDHSMTWQSFSTIKAIVKRPTKPIPPDADADAWLLLLM